MESDPAALSRAQLDLVADVIAQAGDAVAGPLDANLMQGGRSNLTYRLSDGLSAWVLRTPPRVGRTPSAHDVAREFRITAALADTDVPVARAVAFCDDEGAIGGPFAIAEFVHGMTIRTSADLDECDDAAVAALTARLLEALAVLHRVDFEDVGLADFNRPGSYAARQLKRWSQQWPIVGERGLDPLAQELIGRLSLQVPEQRATAIVHGDYRIDNTIIGLERGAPSVAAIVDWELSTVGDPVADVAMLCAYRNPSFDLIMGQPSAWASPRFGDASSLASAYEAGGGVELADWDFHLALAYFKIAVIAAGIDHRMRAGAGSGQGFDTAGQAVQACLESGLGALGA